MLLDLNNKFNLSFWVLLFYVSNILSMSQKPMSQKTGINLVATDSQIRRNFSKSGGGLDWDALIDYLRHGKQEIQLLKEANEEKDDALIKKEAEVEILEEKVEEATEAKDNAIIEKSKAEAAKIALEESVETNIKKLLNYYNDGSTTFGRNPKDVNSIGDVKEKLNYVVSSLVYSNDYR